jgi:hypothetical protein
VRRAVAEHGVLLRGDFRSREKEKLDVELDAVASLVPSTDVVTGGDGYSSRSESAHGDRVFGANWDIARSPQK